MKELLHRYRHAWILSYMFLYFAWFAWLEENVRSRFHVMHVDLDDEIPFCEYFIVPYLLWFLYVAGTVVYFFFRDKRAYYRCCTLLFTGMTISLMVCTVYPNGTDLRPIFNPGENVFTQLVAELYKIDTCTNVFPSIHVFNSIATHLAIIKSDTLGKKKGICGASLVLAISICLSTVFLKQHSAADVMGASVLVFLLYQLVYGFRFKPIRRRPRRISRKTLNPQYK